jgi:tetratricopeptide (TPR) repeat protein
MAVCSLLLGSVALQKGDASTARTRVEEGLLLYREIGYREGIAEAISLLGKVEAARGDLTYARKLYEEGLTMARELGQRELIATGLEGLARISAAEAARILGRAEALREALGAPLHPVERSDYDTAVAAAQHQLGQDDFISNWQAGRLQPVE